MNAFEVGADVQITWLDGFEESGAIKKIFPLHDYIVFAYSVTDEAGRKGSASFTSKDLEKGNCIVKTPSR